MRIDGKLEPAEALFDALVRDFTDIGEMLYGAVAALDLAELYLERGRVVMSSLLCNRLGTIAGVTNNPTSSAGRQPRPGANGLQST